ncbi:acylphosphatase [Enterococcus hermanniensis]|uniref:acylphosphatase n=1 Tax=Enterococcus hermanniensis TaxID=249189 RepID=A0A1L8TNK9_9ENTE|nr:acylphosphatase [Enterococcus hermanniensis]OJG45915.1 hypothetical protein RV04_GL001681 [Enterococcus hermanniensis]
MKLHLNVSGRVQGVGFRYTTQQIASEIGITGTVKNESDGTVTIEAVGTDKQINQFLDQLKHPQNPFAKVEHIEQQEDATIKDYERFKVVY